MSHLMPKLGTPIKVRVRGQKDGGWRGNPKWTGFITFTRPLTETGMPSVLKIAIPGLPGSLFLSSIRLPNNNDDPYDLWIRVEGWWLDALGSPIALESEKSEFVVHRECIDCFEPFALPGDEPEETTVENSKVEAWMPDEKERELIEFWTRVLDVSKENLNPVMIRTLAVAIIRKALRLTTNIDEGGDFQAQLGLVRLPGQLNLSLLRSQILSILHTTGLQRFATLGTRTLSFQAPASENIYEWSRLLEQVSLLPLEALKIDVLPYPEADSTPQTGHPGVDSGLQEALAVCKKVDLQFGPPKKG